MKSRCWHQAGLDQAARPRRRTGLTGSRRRRGLLQLGTSAIALSLIATGSGGASASSLATKGKLPPVRLNVYFPAWTVNPSPESNKVFAAANRIIKSKINATVDFHVIPSTDYNTKVPTLLASHTEMDLLYSADWLSGYTTPAEQGAFDPMNGLLKKYGKGITKWEPKFMVKSGTVNGKIYGIGTLQYNPLQPNWQVQVRALKASGLKYKNVGGLIILNGPNKYKENNISTLMANAKKKMKTGRGFTMMGYPATYAQQSAFDPIAYGLWPIFGSLHTQYPLYVKMGTTKVTLGLPQLRSYAKLMRTWNQDGYMEKDAGTNATPPALTPAQSAVGFNWSGGGALSGAGSQYPGYTAGEVSYQIPLGPRPFFMGYNGGWSIPDSSANPARAMRLLNLLFTNSKLETLLSYGFKGIDYTVKNDTVVPSKSPKYNSSNSCWEWGNCFLTPTWSYAAGSSAAGPGFWKRAEKYLDDADVAPLSSFVFNQTPVSTEWSELTAATSAIDQPLFTGSVPVGPEFAKYVRSIKTAGIATIQHEVQRQLNAYLEKNPSVKKALRSETYKKLMSEPVLEP